MAKVQLRRGRRILQVDEDRRLARARVALQVIDARRLLQLAFDAVGDLLERVGEGGSRPGRLHHHGFHGKVRVLAPPEPKVGPDACGGDDEHEIGHQRAVPERPFGEVEAHHSAPPSWRTFWPGCSVCTPAVTTISPASSPRETTTSAGSYRETSTLRSDTVWLLGSSTHTAGRPSASVSAPGGTCRPAGVDSLTLPVTVEPSCIDGGGSMMPTL